MLYLPSLFVLFLDPIPFTFPSLNSLLVLYSYQRHTYPIADLIQSAFIFFFLYYFFLCVRSLLSSPRPYLFIALSSSSILTSTESCFVCSLFCPSPLFSFSFAIQFATRNSHLALFVHILVALVLVLILIVFLDCFFYFIFFFIPSAPFLLLLLLLLLCLHIPPLFVFFFSNHFIPQNPSPLIFPSVFNPFSLSSYSPPFFPLHPPSPSSTLHLLNRHHLLLISSLSVFLFPSLFTFHSSPLSFF